MVEGVLVKQVRLVEQERGMDALGGAVCDVAAELVEQAAGGDRGGRQAECETELAIEVAAAEGGIVAIGETEAGGGDAMPERAQDAGLADAGLTDEDDGGALVERLEQGVDDALFGGWQPEVRVENFFGEWRVLEREVREIGDGHGQSSSDVRWRGVRPAARSSSALGGSNGTEVLRLGAGRLRRVLPAATASTGRSG